MFFFSGKLPARLAPKRQATITPDHDIVSPASTSPPTKVRFFFFCFEQPILFCLFLLLVFIFCAMCLKIKFMEYIGIFFAYAWFFSMFHSFCMLFPCFSWYKSFFFLIINNVGMILFQFTQNCLCNIYLLREGWW